MNEYIPIICFVAGAVGGALTYHFGFKTGFRASFEIRQSKEDYPDDEGKGLFKKDRDPAEFGLIKDDEDVER